jgi:hypothetical protein
MEDVLMMCPGLPVVRMAFTAAWHPTSRARTLVSNIARHASTSPSMTEPRTL